MEEDSAGVFVPIDTTIATFEPTTLVLSILKQPDNTKIGERRYQLSAWYDIPINYKVSQNFKLTIYHQCTKNTITPFILSPSPYFVDDPTYTVSFPAWKSLYPVCDPLTYTAVLVTDTEGYMPLPAFLTFKEETREFRLQTASPFDEGVHLVSLRAKNAWNVKDQIV